MGIIIPFEYGQADEEPALLKWDLSYLYAELWMPHERGRRLLAPSLPEFSTQDSRPECIGFPYRPRRPVSLNGPGGEATFPSSSTSRLPLWAALRRTTSQTKADRETLKSLGLARDTFGPIRRSDDVTIHIDRSVWAEEILPQWDLADEFESFAPIPGDVAAAPWSTPAPWTSRPSPEACKAPLTGSDLQEILQQFRNPIVGL